MASHTHSHSLLLPGGTDLGDGGGEGKIGVGGGEDTTTTNNGKKGKPKVDFDDRIEQLKIFKATFGHVNVREKMDKSLYEFCRNMRRGRRGKKKAKITEERIAALDAIGFDWKLPTDLSSSEDVIRSTNNCRMKSR